MVAGGDRVVIGNEGTCEITRVTLHKNSTRAAAQCEIEYLEVAGTSFGHVSLQIPERAWNRLYCSDLALRADLRKGKRRHANICTHIQHARILVAQKPQDGDIIGLKFFADLLEVITLPIYFKFIVENSYRLTLHWYCKEAIIESRVSLPFGSMLLFGSLGSAVHLKPLICDIPERPLTSRDFASYTQVTLVTFSSFGGPGCRYASRFK